MTYTVMARCEKSGQIGIATATFAPNVGLVVPHLTGVLPKLSSNGAIIAIQSFTNPILGYEAINHINNGLSLKETLAKLEAFDDPLFEHRQIGMISASGEISARTGNGIGPILGSHCGHIIGKDYLILVNGFVDDAQIKQMASPMEDRSITELSERLMRTLEAGRDSGGQRDPMGNKIPELSSILQVYGEGPLAEVNLRVDFDLTAVEKLRRLLNGLKPLKATFKMLIEEPHKMLESPPPFLDMYLNQI